VANQGCLLNIDKPRGITSRAVVDQVARLVGIRRIGHAGTLDPLATGVLVVALGRATRLIEFIQQCRKTYEAEIRLGQSSDTDDCEGAVHERPDVTPPCREQVNLALQRFVGIIEQRPPTYSAIKVAGKRAYHLARRGQDVDLSPRVVSVHSIELTDYAFPLVRLRISCGQGVYIRSLARDLGEALRIGGLLYALRRTAVGPFTDAKAAPLASLQPHTWSAVALPTRLAAAELPHARLAATEVERFRRGQSASLTVEHGADLPGSGAVAVMDLAGEFLGIGRMVSSKEVRPVKVFD
jgi:tRNA pseudouridine55 synthase